MDNGKPIRETRDIDIPMVAHHFLLNDVRWGSDFRSGDDITDPDLDQVAAAKLAVYRKVEQSAVTNWQRRTHNHSGAVCRLAPSGGSHGFADMRRANVPSFV
jgi:hypothetical protein